MLKGFFGMVARIKSVLSEVPPGFEKRVLAEAVVEVG